MSSPDAVVREPLYIAGTRFGWYHRAPHATPLDCCAVICSAMAPEYTRSHRTLRHLADRLAARGVPSVRFDYHGSGDSPGDEFAPDRWAAWQRDVRESIREARRLTGRPRVCLIGLRLGATLAACVAGGEPVDLLVLWSPCLTGRAYLRELQAMALGEAQAPGRIEGAGAVFSEETAAALRSVDLRAIELNAGRKLVVARDDLAFDPSYAERIGAETLVGAGYAGMMAEHQFTVVPETALSTIVGWIAGHSAASSQPLPGFAAPAGQVAVSASVEEAPCRFGPAARLFGVLSRPRTQNVRQAVVLCNAGSVHHVGPHRLWVALARSLAEAGCACLRFDLAGIGDSVVEGAARENHPYPETASEDTKAALEYLSERYGYRSFVLVGLCAGAHTAFRAGAALEGFAIPELVLINPLTFRWREGMSLATSDLARTGLRYRKAVRDPRRWLRLLRGEIDYRRLAAWLASLTRRRGDGAVRADLARVRALGRRITIVVGDSDPGYAILMDSAGRVAKSGVKAGWIRKRSIADADHTFSRAAKRAELIDCLVELHAAPARAAASFTPPWRPRASPPSPIS